jgi:energy-coupling factor transporter ATP-binding protein EcfA2
MITKVVIENFKRFSRQEFDLDESIVLAGPNNSGKSTLLQALSTWSMALERWRLGKGRIGAKRHGNASTARIRTGQPVTRKDFTALPLREFSLLWHKTLTALRKSELGPKQQLGEPRLIHITVHGSKGFSPGPGWSLTMELRYQSTEQIYVKPVIPAGKQLPPEAEELLIVHCPPFSGIGAEERRLDRGAQQLEVGKGKPGDILRNLLLEVSQNEAHWEFLAKDIKDLSKSRYCRLSTMNRCRSSCASTSTAFQEAGVEKTALFNTTSPPEAADFIRSCCFSPSSIRDRRRCFY